MYEHKIVSREVPEEFKHALRVDLKGEELDN
jgi:hypothetical protein